MYDLTVDPRKFATEQILTCSSADYDKDYTQISTEDAARLCKADTSNSVKFWTNKKSAHGGFRHQFDKLLGSMGVAAVGEEAMKSRYYKVQDKPGREAHDRNVLGRGRFRNAQEWSAWPVHLETSASFVGPDVRGWRAWLVCCSILCLCALNVKMLRVQEAGCTVACCVGVRVQASCSGTVHVLWCAYVPCCGCSLQPRLVDAVSRLPKCERTWHPSI